MSKFVPPGMGWLPDLPDARDYNYRQDEILQLLGQLKNRQSKILPKEVDLSHDEEGEYFTTPVDDQGELNSSSACAVVGLIEYFERRIHGRAFEGSRLFLYKAVRNYLQKQFRVAGDTGADLRTTLKAATQIGIPPAEYWSYHIEKYDEQPSAFLYSLAKTFDHLRYFRLDTSNCSGSKTWETVKSFLAAGFPVVFGFSVPTSLTAEAMIPFRPKLDGIRGGQAVVAVGYRTNHCGRGQHSLLIRNSWGSRWGDNGNGWLPISFLREQLAKDFWTIMSEQWLDSVELSQPSVIESILKTRRIP